MMTLAQLRRTFGWIIWVSLGLLVLSLIPDVTNNFRGVEPTFFGYYLWLGVRVLGFVGMILGTLFGFILFYYGPRGNAQRSE